MLAIRISRLSLAMGGMAPKMAPKISTTRRTCTNFFAAISKPVEAVTASPVAAPAMLMPSMRALVAVAAVTVLTPVAFAMEAGGGDPAAPAPLALANIGKSSENYPECPLKLMDVARAATGDDLMRMENSVPDVVTDGKLQ